MQHIYINGKILFFSKWCSVTELINFLKLDDSLVILEYNKMILPKAFWTKTIIENKDQFEFVSIVGGG